MHSGSLARQGSGAASVAEILGDEDVAIYEQIGMGLDPYLRYPVRDIPYV